MRASSDYFAFGYFNIVNHQLACYYHSGSHRLIRRYETMKCRSTTTVWILLAFLFVLIFAVQHITKDKDITIFNIDWKCNDINCNISFEIENRRIYPVMKDINITAMRDGYSKYGSTSRSVGEKIISIELSSNESKRIEEELKVSGIVNRVIVNPWDKK